MELTTAIGAENNLLADIRRLSSLNTRAFGISRQARRNTQLLPSTAVVKEAMQF